MSKYVNFITLVKGDLVCNIPDGMTNGDVIQALFPNVSKYNNMLLENHSRNILFDDDWWNAPYRKGGEWMTECENCDYSDIADWEQDKKTGKATPIYWCERHKEFCANIKECQHISGKSVSE